MRGEADQDAWQKVKDLLLILDGLVRARNDNRDREARRLTKRRMMALAKEAAGLTNRLATETDAEFLHLTQTKLDKAHSKLAEKIRDFEKEPSCELHNTFCDFSKKFGGPAFDLHFAVFDGPV